MTSDKTFYGLILIGGESSRMGSPKYLLEYHGIPQVNYIYSLLEKICKAVYISCSEEQSQTISLNHCIIDSEQFQNCGPLGGVLSAFGKISGPLIVVGCDYPFLNEQDILELIAARDKDAIATYYINPDDNLPEPFPGIYEIKSNELLLQGFANKEYSLRKFLTATNANGIKSSHPECLKSIDTPEAFNKVKTILTKQ